MRYQLSKKEFEAIKGSLITQYPQASQLVYKDDEDIGVQLDKLFDKGLSKHIEYALEELALQKKFLITTTYDVLNGASNETILNHVAPADVFPNMFVSVASITAKLLMLLGLFSVVLLLIPPGWAFIILAVDLILGVMSGRSLTGVLGRMIFVIFHKEINKTENINL